MRTLIAALAASCLAMAAEHGFEPIFDGESLNGWSLLARKDATGSWQVRDGTLTVQGRPGSLGTLADYGDFELRLEWMVGPQGNSGVFYRFEGTGNPAEVAIEYQLADNARPASQKFAVRKAGAAYGLYAPPEDARAPPEEWNSMRIVARGSHVEHWMNGQKIAEFDCESDDFLERVRASGRSPGFAKARSGRIVLQDHGGLVAFRKIRIRRLE